MRISVGVREYLRLAESTLILTLAMWLVLCWKEEHAPTQKHRFMFKVCSFWIVGVLCFLGG